MSLLKIFVPLAVVSIILTSSQSAYAVEYKVGVKEGDWLLYGDISQSGNFTHSGFIKDAKQTEWVKLLIEKVSGDEITAKIIIHYENNTEEALLLVGDIKGGSGNLSLALLVISAGLNKGDLIPYTASLISDQAPPSFFINDTLMKNYVGVEREVNVVQVSFYFWGSLNVTSYYDKATGVLTEEKVSAFLPQRGGGILPAEVGSISFKVVETNLWGPPIWSQLWFQILIPSVIAVAIILGIVIVRIRKPSLRPTPLQN